MPSSRPPRFVPVWIRLGGVGTSNVRLRIEMGNGSLKGGRVTEWTWDDLTAYAGDTAIIAFTRQEYEEQRRRMLRGTVTLHKRHHDNAVHGYSHSFCLLTRPQTIQVFWRELEGVLRRVPFLWALPAEGRIEVPPFLRNFTELMHVARQLDERGWLMMDWEATDQEFERCAPHAAHVLAPLEADFMGRQPRLEWQQVDGQARKVLTVSNLTGPAWFQKAQAIPGHTWHWASQRHTFPASSYPQVIHALSDVHHYNLLSNNDLSEITFLPSQLPDERLDLIYWLRQQESLEAALPLSAASQENPHVH